MFNRLYLAFFDFPIRFSGSGYSDAQLVIDPPMLRKSIVFRMVKNGYVRSVLSAFDFDADIDPIGSLAFCFFIFLPSSIVHFAVDAFFPWHTNK